ncbi:MAG TPA: HD domain-containing phosphohydrolase [Anaerolineaceae bacterium]
MNRTAPLSLNRRDPQVLPRLYARANQIANTTQLENLLTQLLAFSMELSHASAGIVYLLGQDAPLIVHSALGLPNSKVLPGTTVSEDQNLACQCLLTGHASVRDLWGVEMGNMVDLSVLRGMTLRNTAVLPIPERKFPTGVLQLFNLDASELDLVQALCDRLASDVQKLLILQSSEERTRRLQSMLGYMGRIDPALEPQQNLSTIIENASMVLGAEVCSLFLADDNDSDLVLQISSRDDHNRAVPLRVPRGKGIISYVVETGENVLVRDIQRDLRHYKGLDVATDLTTRSLIAVPLVRRSIQLANGRVVSSERTIGGLEAINKINGEFDAVDLSMLENFAKQATTVLQIANLYKEADELFLDAIRALTAAIDAKDAYTQGHSQRVSDYSVAISIEMSMDSEFIHRIRIGSMLHDVGKIGIPDEILQKRGELTPAEYEMMKQHPSVGETMLSKIRTLRSELAAVMEHHERLDGSGYPRGLRGDEISMVGRIVAVADAFDAMTSDRPYRKRMSNEEAIARLQAAAGSKFDRNVVNALINVYHSNSLRQLFQSGALEGARRESAFIIRD